MKFWSFINLPWGHVRSHTKLGTDRFSRFEVYRTQKTDRQAVYRLSNYCSTIPSLHNTIPARKICEGKIFYFISIILRLLICYLSNFSHFQFSQEINLLSLFMILLRNQNNEKFKSINNFFFQNLPIRIFFPRATPGLQLVGHK